MRQQLCLSAWILAYVVLCVCVRTALLFFRLFAICTILNAVEGVLAWKKQTSPPAHSMCTATQQALKRPRLPSGLQLVLTMGTEESISFPNATLLPQCLCGCLLLVKHWNDSILSTSQLFPCPMASPEWREYELHFGPELSKLQICPSWPPTHHFSPPLIPAPEQRCCCLVSHWHKGAQPGRALLGEPPQPALWA